MEQAAIYYVTTNWSIERIARLLSMRTTTVRDYLKEKFGVEFFMKRQKNCYAQPKRGSHNPNFGKRPVNYKGITSDGQGYLLVPKPIWYTGRKKSKHVFQHSVVMCEHIGLTEIPKGFVVHHIDGDGTNNNVNNLCLMSMGAHQRLHMFGGSETIPEGSRSERIEVPDMDRAA